MWDLGVEEGKMKILRKIETWKSMGEFDFVKSLSVLIMHVLLFYVDLIHVAHAH